MCDGQVRTWRPNIDVFLGLLSALTGGESHYYANYNKSKDGLAFTNMLNRSLTREQGYNAALRVRCSNGKATKE